MALQNGASMDAPELEVIVQCELWDAHPDAVRVIGAALTQARDVSKQDGDVAILLTDDSTIRSLNRQWRQQDKATNVLSFPSTALGGSAALATRSRHIGDIAIAYETVAREAQSEGKQFMHHVAHLAVHGYLHLVGYDHDTHKDAEVMEGLERGILAHLGIPDPYAERNEI